MYKMIYQQIYKYRLIVAYIVIPSKSVDILETMYTNTFSDNDAPNILCRLYIMPNKVFTHVGSIGSLGTVS